MKLCWISIYRLVTSPSLRVGLERRLDRVERAVSYDHDMPPVLTSLESNSALSKIRKKRLGRSLK